MQRASQGPPKQVTTTTLGMVGRSGIVLRGIRETGRWVAIRVADARGPGGDVVGGGSSFGRLFSVTTFGESHGGGLGVVIDGCPAGLVLDLEAIQAALSRRRPGQSRFVSARKEADAFEVLSGLFDGRTLGTPLALLVRNKDADPRAYKPFADRYRPSHADFTYDAKHGFRTWQGGGRASARETVARVAAGAVAEQVLQQVGPIEIVAWVDRLAGIQASVDAHSVTRADVEAHLLRCPDAQVVEAMEAAIAAARKDGDTVGGVVRCVVRGVPPGLGEPVFDKLEAVLAGAMLSIPAAKGFESGSGYGGVDLRGPYPVQPLGRNSRGHQQRDAHLVLGGVQAGGDGVLRAGDHRQPGAVRHREAERPP